MCIGKCAWKRTQFDTSGFYPMNTFFHIISKYERKTNFEFIAPTMPGKTICYSSDCWRNNVSNMICRCSSSVAISRWKALIYKGKVSAFLSVTWLIILQFYLSSKFYFRAGILQTTLCTVCLLHVQYRLFSASDPIKCITSQKCCK
jgi:hypothetical protein